MLKHVFLTLLAVVVACALLLFPQLSASAVTASLSICADSIIPSLFPFMILTDLWIVSGCADYVGRLSARWMCAYFHMPGISASALITGAVGGFPLGAKTVASLYTDGKLTKEQSEHLLLFCSNAGPAFIFGFIGQRIFQSNAAAALLWGIHLVGAILLGVLFRPKDRPLPSTDPDTPAPKPMGESLVCAITKAGFDTIRICIFVTLFTIVSTFIEAILPAVFKTTVLSPLLFGVIELASSTAHCQHITPHAAFVLLSILLAWNGCCVHLQVSSVVSQSKLSMRKYFIGKTMHMLISLLLSLLCAPLLFGVPLHAKRSFYGTWMLAAVFTVVLFLLLTKTPYRKKLNFHI